MSPNATVNGRYGDFALIGSTCYTICPEHRGYILRHERNGTQSEVTYLGKSIHGLSATPDGRLVAVTGDSIELFIPTKQRQEFTSIKVLNLRDTPHLVGLSPKAEWIVMANRGDSPQPLLHMIATEGARTCSQSFSYASSISEDTYTPYAVSLDGRRLAYGLTSGEGWQFTCLGYSDRGNTFSCSMALEYTGSASEHLHDLAFSPDGSLIYGHRGDRISGWYAEGSARLYSWDPPEGEPTHAWMQTLANGRIAICETHRRREGSLVYLLDPKNGPIQPRWHDMVPETFIAGYDGELAGLIQESDCHVIRL